MADEKVIMVPESGNSLDPNMLLANNGNNMWNNPFMYLIFLALFGNGGFGFNNQKGTDTLSSQIADNHNNDLAMQAIQGNGTALHELAGNLNVGVTSLNAAINSIQENINRVASTNAMGISNVIQEIGKGNLNMIQQFKDCCCENKILTQQMGYEGQLRDQANTAAITGRIDQLANGITQGFSATSYETAQQTNALQNSLQNQTQTIIDKLSNMESNAQQDKINTLTAQLTAANARAERAAELQPIINQLNAIKSGQPSTTTVQYPQLTAIPSYQLYGYSSNSGFWG